MIFIKTKSILLVLITVIIVLVVIRVALPPKKSFEDVFKIELNENIQVKSFEKVSLESGGTRIYAKMLVDKSELDNNEYFSINEGRDWGKRFYTFSPLYLDYLESNLGMNSQKIKYVTGKSYSMTIWWFEITGLFSASPGVQILIIVEDEMPGTDDVWVYLCGTIPKRIDIAKNT